LSNYSSQLRDQRWQRRRLEILEKDRFTCQHCGNEDIPDKLHVHHVYYERGLRPWEYPDKALISLCRECHESETFLRPTVNREMAVFFRRLTAIEMERILKAVRRIAESDEYDVPVLGTQQVIQTAESEQEKHDDLLRAAHIIATVMNRAGWYRG